MTATLVVTAAPAPPQRLSLPSRSWPWFLARLLSLLLAGLGGLRLLVRHCSLTFRFLRLGQTPHVARRHLLQDPIPETVGNGGGDGQGNSAGGAQGTASGGGGHSGDGDGSGGGGSGPAAPSYTDEEAIKRGEPVMAENCSGGSREHGYCLDRGPRDTMEDAVESMGVNLSLSPEGSKFYAVYDGHNGSTTVAFVQRRLPEVLRSRAATSADLRTTLEESFVQVDDELLLHLRSRELTPKLSGQVQRAQTDFAAEPEAMPMVLSSGTVCCAVAIVGLGAARQIFVANLGDCRAILCTNGSYKALSVDHRAADPNVGGEKAKTEEERTRDDMCYAERQRLGALGVEVSSDGYLHGKIGVSRALGNYVWDLRTNQWSSKCLGILNKPDVVEQQLPDDAEFLLIGCDGIFEKMGTDDAGRVCRRALRKDPSAIAAAEAVVKDAKGRNGSDNMSAVVIVFRPPPPVASSTVGTSAPRLFGGGAKRKTLAELEAAATPPEAAPAAPEPKD